MVQRGSVVKVADNTGAKFAKIIGIPGFSRRKWVHAGEMVVVAVQEALPKGMVKDHSVNEAVVVRTKKEIKRKDGSYIRFDDNAVVLLEKGKKTPMGTRIFGPISRELKDKGYDKIASLAPEVI
jgi:large subunit ribosomal protein L14